MNLVQLGVLLRDKREALGIPLAMLARRAGIGRSTLWSLERGENPKTGKPSRPAKDILERLAVALNLEQAELDELLLLAGYTTDKYPAIQPSQLALIEPAPLPREPQLLESLIEGLHALNQTSQDIKVELRDLKQGLFGEKPLAVSFDNAHIMEAKLLTQYPTYYPAIFQDFLWNIWEENYAHVCVMGRPLKGRNLLEAFFSPDLRRFISASDWEETARRAMWYFKVSITGFFATLEQKLSRAEYEQEYTRLHAQYIRLTEQLALLPDFVRLFESREPVEEFTFPNGSENAFPACELAMECRLSSLLQLRFQTVVQQWRTNGEIHIHEVLIPQNTETKAALILMYLAQKSVLTPGSHDSLPQQALRVLAIVKTVEMGLVFGEVDKQWCPQQAYQHFFTASSSRFHDLPLKNIDKIINPLQDIVTGLDKKMMVRKELLVDMVCNFDPFNPFLKNLLTAPPAQLFSLL